MYYNQATAPYSYRNEGLAFYWLQQTIKHVNIATAVPKFINHWTRI